MEGGLPVSRQVGRKPNRGKKTGTWREESRGMRREEGRRGKTKNKKVLSRRWILGMAQDRPRRGGEKGGAKRGDWKGRPQKKWATCEVGGGFGWSAKNLQGRGRDGGLLLSPNGVVCTGGNLLSGREVNDAAKGRKEPKKKKMETFKKERTSVLGGESNLYQQDKV